jgi:hypothetical protein
MPAAPALRPPAVDANGAAAGARYAAGIGQSLQPLNFQVVPLPAAQVSMAVQPQVPLGSARRADLRLTANVGGSSPTVLRQPAAEYGAHSEVVISAGYLDELTAQLRAAQDETRYLREQLHPRNDGTIRRQVRRAVSIRRMLSLCWCLIRRREGCRPPAAGKGLGGKGSCSDSLSEIR